MSNPQHDPQSFYLIDGSELVFRSFFAFEDMCASDQTPCGALVGVMRWLMHFVNRHDIRRIAVFFDTSSSKNSRTHIYEAYKAQRQKMPETLSVQWGRIHDFLRIFCIPVILHQKWEADDLIASYAQALKAQGYHSIVVAHDKDFFQILDLPFVSIYHPKTKSFVTEGIIHQKYGVKPQQMICLQALVGDTVDNIPGVPGVGPKTAAKWLTAYHNLDGIVRHHHLLPKRFAEYFAQHADQIYIYRALVTLDCHADLDRCIHSLKRGVYDYAELQHFVQHCYLEEHINL